MASSNASITVQIVGFSPDGATITAAKPGTLLDISGATWATMPIAGTDFVAGQTGLSRNGTRVFGSITTCTIKAGVIYVNDPLPPVGSGSGWLVNVPGTAGFNTSAAP
jgi:hypothetical protein